MNSLVVTVLEQSLVWCHSLCNMFNFDTERDLQSHKGKLCTQVSLAVTFPLVPLPSSPWHFNEKYITLLIILNI